MLEQENAALSPTASPDSGFCTYRVPQHYDTSETPAEGSLEDFAKAIQADAVEVYGRMTSLLIRLREGRDASSNGALTRKMAGFVTGCLYRMEQHLFLYTDAAQINRTAIGQELLANRYCQIPPEFELKVFENRLCIKLPHLPSRASTKLGLIYEPLGALLYNRRTEIPLWTHCKVDFCHIYPRKVKWMPRDVDNYAYKRIIDLLAFAVGFSDCAEGFESSQRTIFTDEIPSGTYIEISPKSSENIVLPDWL